MAQTTRRGQRGIAAPRGARAVSATRVIASVFGVLAGILGVEHGYFETLQGNVAPGGIGINAIGPPCQPDQVWHGCEPAMTIIPNFLVTGILAIVVSLAVLTWAAAFVQRKHGGLILILLSVAQLLVGGGFTTVYFGVIAGVVGTKSEAPLTWWRVRLPASPRRFLAALWPWTLIAYLVWFPSEWILGHFFGELMLKLTLVVTVATPGFLLLIVLSALAHDAQRLAGSPRTPSRSG